MAQSRICCVVDRIEWHSHHIGVHGVEPATYTPPARPTGHCQPRAARASGLHQADRRWNLHPYAASLQSIGEGARILDCFSSAEGWRT